MTITPKLIASRLCVEESTIDAKYVAKAEKAVQSEGKAYWDALANSGQLHGNVPHSTMVAIVYRWLMGDDD